jgi:ABC-type multidrug transport system fused ATPase/permease subunit
MADEKKTVPKLQRLSTAWRDSRELIWTHRHRLMLGLLLLLIERTAGFVLPWSSKYFAQEIIEKGNAGEIWPLAGKIAAATLIQAAAGFALAQVLGVAAQKAITDMRKSMEQHVQRLPVSYFDSTQTGVLLSRIMTDAEGIRNLVGNGLVQLVGSVITGIVAMVVLFSLNWKLTAITLLILGGFGSAMTFAFKRLRPVFRERGKINAEVTGRLTQSIGGVRVVKAYTAERREDLVFAQGAHRLFRNVAQTITGTSGIGAFSTLVIGAIGMAMIVVGGHSILSGAMSAPDAILYIVFVAMLAMPVIQIAAIGTQITEAFAGLDRINEIKRMAREDADETRAALPEVRGDIAFEKVYFEYNPGVLVLKDINFTAPSGTTTALVGSSGSGKSTVIGLIMAFHRPLKGRVTVDGTDLTTVRLRDYRSQLGVVLQDNFLFDGTIAENIGFARPHATRAEIENAARIAHCLEFINGFEQKFDTLVGERGIRLSGGQRQRVAIARAILADPRILILDEATSSLDSESEALIQDGLRSLRSGRTTFVIAHRLSTIRSADQILVLEHGEIIEHGNHHDLMEKNGRYRELHDRQYKLEMDRFVNPGEELPSLDASRK